VIPSRVVSFFTSRVVWAGINALRRLSATENIKNSEYEQRIVTRKDLYGNLRERLERKVQI